jgi:hypothetical protein
MVSQVSFLYQIFLKQREANLYGLGITPQVCYLEKMLNDRFDFIQRRVYIGDPTRKDVWNLYVDDELKPVNLYVDDENEPITTYTDMEGGEGTVDFVVYVPSGLSLNENEMRALLDIYKVAGKTYYIETY